MDYTEGYQPSTEQQALEYFRHTIFAYRAAMRDLGVAREQLNVAERIESEARSNFLRSRQWLEKFAAGDGNMVGDGLYAGTTT